MNIFLVSNLYPSKKYPNFGTFVKSFEDNFIQQGGRVVCKAVVDRKIDNFVLKLLNRILFCFKVIFLGLYKSPRYDVIYVHYIAHTAIPIYILSLLISKKIVLNVHGDDLLYRSNFVKFMLLFVKKMLHKVSLVVVPSLFFKEKFLEYFYYDPLKVYVNPSGGIDRNIFKFRYSEHSLCDNKNHFILGYVSRIDEGKGWKLFVDSIAMLIKEYPNIRGIMIGDGSQKNELDQYLMKKNVLDHIIYFSNVPHVELSKYYSMMNLFVFPTQLEESLGLVGLEAMACGIPVIGSNIGGLPSYIIDNYNGFLFVPGDVKDLNGKILHYIHLDEAERLKMEKNSMETADLYDANIVARNMYLQLEKI